MFCRNGRWGIAVAIAGAVAIATPAGAESGPPKKVATVEGITEYRLDNGARVLLYPDPSSARVTVNMTVLVGSRHEGYGETGMAHLLEHMVFKGTDKHRDIPALMKERGAQFNGSTDFDRTNYFETLPASEENLAFALGLEADRLVHSFVRGEDLKTEMTVVRNEFESGENSPTRILAQRMMATAFEWHNYGKDTIGNRSDIERVPIDNLRAFYRKYYQPDNVVVVVAGKFDEHKALDLASKTFGAIPRADRKLDAAYTEEPPQDGERVVTLRRVGDVPIVGVLYHVPAGPDPEFAAVQVLASLLASQPSGPLYKALVEPKKAASVSARAQATHDPGALMITAEVRKGQSADEVRDTIVSIVETLKENGPAAEQVDRAKRQILKARALADADANQTAIRLSEAIAQGDWRLYFLERDRIERVTPEQVRRVAAKYLARSNRTVGLFAPADTPQRTPIPPRPDITQIVDNYKGRDTGSAGESFEPTPAAIEAHVRRPEPAAGVKLALLPKKTRGEMVYLQLTLRYGDADNLKGLTDAAGFLGELMTRGTKSLNRQQIEDELDKNLARLSAGLGGGGGRRGGGMMAGAAEPGAVTFTLQTKRANLPAVLEILRQVLREPTLPADEFEVLKAQRLARLEEGRTDPARLAANRLQRTLNPHDPDDVRYVPTIDESITRLKATTVEQVRRLYDDYLGAGHGEVAIVGDFEPSEVLPVLGKALDGWKASQRYARIERPAPAGIAAMRETILTPDKANATLLAGLALRMTDDDPDYPALVAGNFILGGGTLSSRIGNRLRQKEGLSYGASSMFNADPLDPRATLMVTAICNPANLPRAIVCMDDEVAKILRDGVTAEELDQAKVGYRRQQEVRRASDMALTALLARDLYLGRTLKHDADLERAIDALTPEAVSSALRRHLDPKRLVVIGAGDLKPSPSGGGR
ncbi:MAG TPA: pitrilysin family protein [Isosphaeraceae bacterium]|jgi:zinc protease|nr:pitrilysin family protein [Isosphaeraceae bacterium]